MTGDLTMRGVTRPVTLEVDPLPPAIRIRGATRGAASRPRPVSRKDWGLKWNLAIEAGGLAVGDEVASRSTPRSSRARPDRLAAAGDPR